MFLDELLRGILAFAGAGLVEFEVTLPVHEAAAIARIHRLAHVLQRRYEDENVILRLRARKAAAAQIQNMIEHVAEELAIES
jgi:50S ribosomal subunit-associated GTPase HflX